MVCHCLLNPNAKVYPLADDHRVYAAELEPFIKAGAGLMQLPCPEVSYLGLNRWGMTKEQYEHPNFRRHCVDILRPSMDQIEAFTQAGYEIVGVFGMDGSPNCGINKTCVGFSGGEICSQSAISGQARGLKSVPGKGVFMDILLHLLLERNINTRFYAMDEIGPTGCT